MRQVLAAVLIIGALAAARAPAVAAQAVGPPSGGTAAHAGGAARVLPQLEDEWAAALVRRDGATFRRLMAARFVYTENDRTIGRDELIRDLVSGSDTVQTARNEDMRVHDFGATAVVTGWLVISGRGAGGAFNNRYRFTDTWVRRAGRWQMVAAHDYLAPQSGR